VDEFNPFPGNVLTLETDEEGNVAEKDSLGRLRYRDVTEEEAINRWNYKKAYYKNYYSQHPGSKDLTQFNYCK
jgi:hypothetical protein